MMELRARLGENNGELGIKTKGPNKAFFRYGPHVQGWEWGERIT